MTDFDLAWCFLIVFVLYLLIAGAARPSSASRRSSRSRHRSGPSTRRRRARTSSSVAEPDPGGATPTPVEIPGPWQHRHVAANGARFHVAEAGPPAAAGPAAARLPGVLVDLARTSCRRWPAPATGPSRWTCAATAAGQDAARLRPDDPRRRTWPAWSRRSAARSAVLVGHGWGGYVAWATAAAARAGGVGAVRGLRARTRGDAARAAGPAALASRHVLAMQLPLAARAPAGRPVRRRSSSTTCAPGAVPARRSRTSDAVATYQRAIGLWPSSHCALEYHRWLFRSRLRADGRAVRAADAPAGRASRCCRSSGAEDPALSADAVRRLGAHVVGRADRSGCCSGVGHFPHEEDPDAFTAVRSTGSRLATGCEAHRRRSAAQAPVSTSVERVRPCAAAPATWSAVRA